MKKIIAAGILIYVIFFSSQVFSQQYITENVVTGLTMPVAFTFLPNGLTEANHRRPCIYTCNPLKEDIKKDSL